MHAIQGINISVQLISFNIEWISKHLLPTQCTLHIAHTWYVQKNNEENVRRAKTGNTFIPIRLINNELTVIKERYDMHILWQFCCSVETFKHTIFLAL